MSKRDKLIKFLIKPPLWVCIVFWSVGAVSLGGSITLYYLKLGLEMWALPVHIVALVFFILSVYAILTIIGVPERAKEKPSVQKFFSSYSTRAFVYAMGSIVFNTCYIAFGIVIATLEHSPWLGVLVGYHIFLILPRVEVLVTAKFRGKKAGVSEEKRGVKAYANCGLMLIMLAVAILPVIKMTLDDQNSYNYFVRAIVYVNAIAAYTFTKLGIAIYNFKKSHKQNDLALIAVKNASLADALISLFTLQAMMLKELHVEGETAELAAKLNPTIGVLIAIGIFALGIHMLISGHKRLKILDA
ncbi:MAG: hypothetical protein K2L54_02680, partial [Clostridiales bacterium]|nr:hypothetical protein [Clostridiales bacterium]